MTEMDPHTLRVIANLVRSRVSRLDRDPLMDGLQRVGANRVLKQLAADLDVTADHAKKPTR